MIFYTFDNLPINLDDNNPYWGAWRAGIIQGLETPFMGIGPVVSECLVTFFSTIIGKLLWKSST